MLLWYILNLLERLPTLIHLAFELETLIAEIIAAATLILVLLLGEGLLPRFFKPNIVIEPSMLLTKSPLLMKYGERIIKEDNRVHCRIAISNQPPNGYARFYQRKGRVPATNVQATLLPKNVEDDYKPAYPLEWSDLPEKPRVLPILQNDGVPISIEILHIQLRDHSITVAGGTGDTRSRYLPPATYDLNVQVESAFRCLGRFKLPEELIALAGTRGDVAYAIRSGGFALYLEKTEDGLIAKFEGNILDDTESLRAIAQKHKPNKILINGKPLDANIQSLLEN